MILDRSKFLTVDDRRAGHRPNARLLMLAASYPQVERLFVQPGHRAETLPEHGPATAPIMGKIRPIYGHDAHFHIRLACPPGATRLQAAGGLWPPATAATNRLAWWFTKEPWAPPKQRPQCQAPAAATAR